MILHHAAQVVTPRSDGTFQILDNGAVVGEGERIAFVGSSDEALARYHDSEAVDVSGKVLLPGFVDAHTHAVFGGDRCSEFLMRLSGATYQEIAAAGGGIQSTVRATRAATPETLLESAARDLRRMLEYGTTTIEIKSGYGLDWPNEKKLLTVAAQLRNLVPQDIVITFLGAHDFPSERTRDQYVHDLVHEMLPQVASGGMADFCDVFCDQGYYTNEQTRTICTAAQRLGLKVKIHADELADVQGAALAAELGAVSADHLIFANEDGISKMAAAGVIAVLLPGTSFLLKMKRQAPARRMIEQGVRVAIATDFNPGTCYSHSMHYILQLASPLYGLSAEESITAATLHAAAAISRADRVGSLEAGKQMDCLVYDIPHYGHLFYNLGVNRLETVIKRGKVAWSKNRNWI
jgi:imidazolonepropionase